MADILCIARGTEELERRDKKNKKKVNWYTRGGYDTVIKVNLTPGGELAKQMQQVLDRNKGPVKVKIQEQGGIKVKNLLQKPNPSKTLGCDNEDCLACKHGRGKGGECMKNNVGNELLCDLCGGENTWQTIGGRLQIPPCGNTRKWSMVVG